MKGRKLRLDDQLCFGLYAATNAATCAYNPKLVQSGITYPQYLLLLVLWQDGPLNIREIAEQLKLPAIGLTPILDRLEQANLFERRLDSHDRRLIQIHLTATGLALETSVATAQNAVVCETELLSEALDELRDTLHALTTRLERAKTTDA
ncbi:MarR family transcriptional regulator [Granulosicoccus sp.]|nr:MarR family transcriptional regulator [Granulosicoccus sp.]